MGVIVLSFAAPDSMEIAGIAVDPAARGQGVGSHMIRQAVRRYRPRHVCAETDDDAVGFYRKNGFRAAAFSEMRRFATDANGRRLGRMNAEHKSRRFHSVEPAAFFMVSGTSNDQNDLIITKTRRFYKRCALTGIATGKRLSIRAKV